MQRNSWSNALAASGAFSAFRFGRPIAPRHQSCLTITNKVIYSTSELEKPVCRIIVQILLAKSRYATRCTPSSGTVPELPLTLWVAVTFHSQTVRDNRDQAEGYCRCSVVLHIGRCRIKLQVALDDLIHSGQKVLLRRDLPSCADSKHTGLCRHASELGTCSIRAQS